MGHAALLAGAPWSWWAAAWVRILGDLVRMVDHLARTALLTSQNRGPGPGSRRSQPAAQPPPADLWPNGVEEPPAGGVTLAEQSARVLVEVVSDPARGVVVAE